MKIAGGDFAAALREITAGWPDLPAIAAGMIGSAREWVKAQSVKTMQALDKLRARGASAYPCPA